MMPAAKMMDPLLGLDIHMIQPPGPVPPLPIPHPFIGMLFDPMDLAPFVGATVLVNGMPRGIAGTAAKAVPPHIPMGGVFVPPPPGNEGEMFMGSSTVQMDGDPASFALLPALTCQTIGMPAPFRMNPKKKTKMKSLQLPLSIVIPIPLGLPVLVGGPPTISVMGMLQKLGMAALGKAMKKLKKAMKASKKVKAVSDRIHKAANKAMKKLGVPPSVQNKVHKGICTVTGHPVDVATGKVFTDNVDFELPGPIPLKWERTWFSCSTYEGPLGHGWHHSYDMSLAISEKAIAIRMADGRPAAFPVLNVGQEYFDRSQKVTLKRDPHGYSLHSKDHRIHRFSQAPDYKGCHPLASISTPAGHIMKFSYDDRGNLEGIQDCGGLNYLILTDDRGRISSIKAPNPDALNQQITLVTYEYDSIGNLVKARDCLNHAWNFEYRIHLLVKETNRNGLSFYFEYDKDGPDAKCLRTCGDGGIYDHKLTYDLEDSTTTVIDSMGRKKTYHFADSGLVLKVEDELGNFLATEYNDFNEPISDIDELGRETAFKYDDRGNCIKATRPDGYFLEKEYHRDVPSTIKDKLGREWKLEYDDKIRPVKKTDPLGNTTEFFYNNANLASVKDGAGLETKLRYDERNRLRSLLAPDGAESRWQYDHLGRCTAALDPNGNTLVKRYDFSGQITRVEDPTGTVREFAYDGEGNIVFMKENERESRLKYTGMNRLALRTESGIKVEFKYDTEERLIAVKNENGLVYGFERGPRGDVDAEIGYDEMRRSYFRDPMGRVLKVERAGGQSTEYEYDFADRILTVNHSNGESESYTYRADGEILSAINDSTEIRFERDLLGRTVKESQGEHWIVSEYDASGRRIRMKSSMGAWQNIKRSELGDVQSVTYAKDGKTNSPHWHAKFERDNMGLELERSLPGGLTSSWKRDKLGRPLRHSIQLENGFRFREYMWGSDRRLKSLNDSLFGLRMFGHDPMGNLIWSKGSDGGYLFRLPDAVGNLFRSEGKGDRKYGPSGQLLESFSENGVTRYAYDLEGNLVLKTGPGGEKWEYRWNAAGMLGEVIRPNGESVTFSYDAMGRRISKSFRGVVRKWIWDGRNPLHEWDEAKQATATGQTTRMPSETLSGMRAERLAAERSATQATAPPALAAALMTPVTWLFEPDSSIPMAKVSGGKHFSIISDHIGTPFSMYDEAGQETWSAELDIYGAIIYHTGIRDACPFRFRGQYEDVETGLYYNRFRYFDPETGGYISQDPLGQLSKLYAYVSDPTLASDPFGLYETVDPNTLNYSQAYVEGDTLDYERDMRNGDWDWDRTSKKGNNVAVINVVEVDGQLVSMDNRRLLAAQNAELPKVPINRVNLDDIKPGTTITWGESLKKRLNSSPGKEYPKIQLPPQGTKTKPKVVPCK